MTYFFLSSSTLVPVILSIFTTGINEASSTFIALFNLAPIPSPSGCICETFETSLFRLCVLSPLESCSESLSHPIPRSKASPNSSTGTSLYSFSVTYSTRGASFFLVSAFSLSLITNFFLEDDSSSRSNLSIL